MLKVRPASAVESQVAAQSSATKVIQKCKRAGVALIASALILGCTPAVSHAKSAPRKGFTVVANTNGDQSAAGIVGIGDAKTVGKSVNIAPVSSSRISGYADIASLGISGNLAPGTNAVVSGDNSASLQLNTDLFVQKDGVKYFFFVQNAAIISPGDGQIQFKSNLWPLGSNNMPLNGNNAYQNFEDAVGQYELGSMSGNGYVLDGALGQFYQYGTGPMVHGLPLKVILTDQIAGSKIYLEYQIVGSAPVIYDTMNIGMMQNREAFFASNGLNKVINPNDMAFAALVVCGDHNDFTGVFSNPTNIYLGLYHNGGRGSVPFSSLTSPNLVNTTGEGSTGLRASIASDGLVRLTNGQTDMYTDNNFSPQSLQELQRR